MEEHKNTNDEIIDQLIIKVEELDKRQIHVPDYSVQLEQLQQGLALHLPNMAGQLIEMKKLLVNKQQSHTYAQLSAQLAKLEEKMDSVPQVIPVVHEHHFDLKTKGWIISGVVLVVVTAITAGLSLSLWSSNSLLKADNVKYRLVKQVAPNVANWTDSVYQRNPEEVERRVEQAEGATTTHTSNTKGSKKDNSTSRHMHKRAAHGQPSRCGRWVHSALLHYAIRLATGKQDSKSRRS